MTRWVVSDSEILAQIPAARRRAQRDNLRAVEVRYDRARRRLHVTLANGTGLVVPIDLIASLQRAADHDIAEVMVGVAGISLRWERLDEDLSMSGLVELAVGRRALLRAAGAAGGASRTAAKVRASRLNGLKGGRPRQRLRNAPA